MSGYNPFYSSANRPLGKTPVRFSKTEIQHLGIAVFALTIAVAFFLSTDPTIMGRIASLTTEPLNVVAAFLAVASGFVLHELAHKFVAIKYGCLAEFRAQMSGLVFAVLITLFTGFIFAAPGAVQIYGRVDQRENGIISVAGPATNMAIATLFLPLVVFVDGWIGWVAFIIAIVNAILGAFNLLPFGPLDGKKVLNWNKAIWGASMAGSILLVLVALWAYGLAF